MNDIAKTADYESPRTGTFDRFLRQQLLGDRGADETGRAGDEDHAPTPLRPMPS